LLLSDVVMPEMSGKELLENVQQLGISRVLFMSGYTDDSIVRHGILSGDFLFLPKPFTRATLLEKVREALSTPAFEPFGNTENDEA